MNFKHGRLASSLLLAGLLSACGGGNDGTPSGQAGTPPGQNQGATPPAASPTSTYSGTVRDTNGQPIANLPVVLENRSSDASYETTTDAEGNFSVEVAPGFYDAIYDDKNATNLVTEQKTAINLNGDQKLEVRMQSASGQAHNWFAGQIKDMQNQPVANRKLLLLSSVARARASAGAAQVPDPVIVESDDKGNFSTALGKPGMDVDLDVLVLAPDAPPLEVQKLANDYPFASELEKAQFQENFDEFTEKHVEESIDIEKPNGALHAEIVIGSGNHNLRGATGAPSVVPADARKLAESENVPVTVASAWTQLKRNAANALLSVIPSAYAGDMIAKFLLVPAQADVSGKINGGILVNGRITPVSESCKYNSLLDMNNGVQAFDKDSTVPASRTKFCVTKGQTLWLYNYKINLLTPKRGHYRFTDEVNDTYALRVMNTFFSHNLRYNSSHPTIVEVEYSTGEN